MVVVKVEHHQPVINHYQPELDLNQQEADLHHQQAATVDISRAVIIENQTQASPVHYHHAIPVKW